LCAVRTIITQYDPKLCNSVATESRRECYGAPPACRSRPSFLVRVLSLRHLEGNRQHHEAAMFLKSTENRPGSMAVFRLHDQPVRIRDQARRLPMPTGVVPFLDGLAKKDGMRTVRSAEKQSPARAAKSRRNSSSTHPHARLRRPAQRRRFSCPWYVTIHVFFDAREILLDNEAGVGVFRNKFLLTDVRKAPHPVRISNRSQVLKSALPFRRT
jgi:hypothetical protein